jgi:hypothetical protein
LARKEAKQERSETQRTPAARSQASLDYRAKVRMYRQGLGDCFLIALPRSDGGSRPFYVMIDCGVILGTRDPVRKITEVVENIIEVTEGEIDLLVATHEHWDHVSGFIQASDLFDRLKVHQVWLAWTENDKDALARQFKAQRDQTLAALRLGLSRLQLAGADEQAIELGGILEFFGAAKGGSTADALGYVKKKSDNLRYCRPDDDPVQPAGTAAKFYVLGPPLDQKLMRKINPSKRDKETFGLALDGLSMFLDGAGTALTGNDNSRPFDRQFEIPFSYAALMPFFQTHYWGSIDRDDDWRRIDIAWLGGSTELALQLDSLTNNTSLVLAIQLPDGDVLLFPADAQVGNWLSWQRLTWDVSGTTVTGPDLLKRVILYKVGHHGSHNATLKELGLNQMEKLRVALLPVDEEMAKTKHWVRMPLDELVKALKDKAVGGVVRIDEPMPASPERIVEDKLFFEVTF